MSLADAVQKLEEDNQELNDTVVKLKLEIDNLQGKVENFDATLRVKQGNIDRLKEDIHTHTSIELTNLKNENAILKATIEAFQEWMAQNPLRD